MFFIFYFLNRFQNSHLYIQTCQTEHWYTGSIAMLYCWCNIAALLVPGCCTFLALIVSRGNTDCFTGRYKLFDGKLCRLVFHI